MKRSDAPISLATISVKANPADILSRSNATSSDHHIMSVNQELTKHFSRCVHKADDPDGVSSVRSLPELVDYNSKENRDYPFCIQGKASGGENESFQTISHAEFQKACGRCAGNLVWTIAEIVLPSQQQDGAFVKGRPVALFINSDVGLLIYMVALMGLGVPVSPLSVQCEA